MDSAAVTNYIETGGKGWTVDTGVHNMAKFSIPISFPRFSWLDMVISVLCCLGLTGHTISIIHVLIGGQNVFGINLASPIIRLGLMKFVSYCQLVRTLPYVKLGLEVLGIISWLILYTTVWRQNPIVPAITYMISALTYASGLIFNLHVAGKWILLGRDVTSLLDHILPPFGAFVLYFFGIVAAIAIILRYRIRSRNSNLLRSSSSTISTVSLSNASITVIKDF